MPSGRSIAITIAFLLAMLVWCLFRYFWYPSCYKQDFILLGLFWQFCGTVFLAGESFNIDWIKKRENLHSSVFSSGWLRSLITPWSAIDRKPFPLRSMLKKSTFVVIFVPLVSLVYGWLILRDPFTVACKVGLFFTFILLVHIWIFALLFFWYRFLQFLLILLVPFAIILLPVLVIAVGPFALGEVMQCILKVRRRYIALGLALMALGLILQAAAILDTEYFNGIRGN